MNNEPDNKTKENKSKNKLRIYKYGENILRKNSKDIEVIDKSIKNLIEEMKIKMVEKNGVGLAAPQIGKSIQLAIIDPSAGEVTEDCFPLINPEIIAKDGIVTDEEGCLSVPGILLQIKRSKNITVRAIDLDGKSYTKTYSDFVARIIQHEMDHLNGKLIIDRISSLKRQFVKKEIKRLKENGEW